MNFFRKLIGIFFIFTLAACIHIPKTGESADFSEPIITLKKREINVVFVAADEQKPGYIIYNKKDRYSFKNMPKSLSFKKDIQFDPLMKNLNFSAVVEKKGKHLREFASQKSMTSVLNPKKNLWSPTRSRQVLVVPYVSDDEEVVISTSYEWMDSRWIMPLVMQEEPTIASVVNIEVPHGVGMSFQVANLGEKFELLPKNQSIAKNIWRVSNNTAGLGTKYIFDYHWPMPTLIGEQSKRLQVFAAFDPPTTNDAPLSFNAWTDVANYLYARFDRYDISSKIISEFAGKVNGEEATVAAKIVRLLSFLQEEIETRVEAESFQNEILQTATKTFTKRSGTPADKAILGKALFSSIGIRSEILAVADKTIMPRITNFYTPALFRSLILAIEVDGKILYFDPAHKFHRFDQLPYYLQGQAALILRKNDGRFYNLPYDSSDRHQKNWQFHLSMDEDGLISGEYELKLSGLAAIEASHLIKPEETNLSASQIQARLLSDDENFFTFRSAKVQQSSLDKGVFEVFGEITPRMLAKKGDAKFSIANAHFLDPFLSFALESAKRFNPISSHFLATLVLPEAYEAKQLLKKINVRQDGLSAQIHATMQEGSIVIEGHSAVDGPFANAIFETYAREISSTKSQGRGSMTIEKLIARVEEENSDQQAHSETSP